ncbi:MAG: hypothetical protein U9N43_03825 [Euryarchaeota archaeon]|nr:hypothetical protein [Euryarchaeota archaeon]
MKNDLVNLRYTPIRIRRTNRKIYHQILRESENIDQGNFNAIAIKDFARLFELYDLHFFDGYFHNRCNGKIFFRLSERMTKSGGKIAYAKGTDVYTIYLSTALIFQTFGGVTREVTVNGIVCHDRLEATMCILEHEIIHLLELVFFDSTSCSKPRFKHLSRNIFGHTEVTHRLVTQAELAQKQQNLGIGSTVSFEYGGETYRGIISRITKRATVMVKNHAGDFRDRKGDRYSKYYIPLENLTHVRSKHARR